MVIPGRKYSAGTGYRYGFNGKENDNDVKGEGKQQDYGMRIYDPRLGKFLSVDPLSPEYPELTPYQFATNRPIDGIDLDGLEHLSAKFSMVTLGINYIELSGKKVIAGGVYLNLENAHRATKFYVNQPGNGSNRSGIASFEHSQYGVISQQLQDANSEVLSSLIPKEPEASDMEAESLKQEKLSIPKAFKNKKQWREVEKTKQFSTPAGGGSSPLGNALVVGVEMTGKIGVEILNNKVQRDFNSAREQLYAVQKTVNDVQFALDNNLAPKEVLNELTGFANYLLDGRNPQEIRSTLGKDGKWVSTLKTDYHLLTLFEKTKEKISKKRVEVKSKPVCTNCPSNN